MPARPTLELHHRPPVRVPPRREALLHATHRALCHGLRSGLVGARDRALHPRAVARRLAPGLYEQVELATGRRGDRRVPGFEELGSLGLGPASLHRIARRNTCELPFEAAVAGPRPGVRVWMLGATRACDAAVVALELPRLLPDWSAPRHGFLLSVPIRGTALYVPLGEEPTDALARANRLGEVRVGDLHAPLDLYETVDHLAHWASHLHARLPGPVSPEVYWARDGRFSLVPRATRQGRIELRPTADLLAALNGARRRRSPPA